MRPLSWWKRYLAGMHWQQVAADYKSLCDTTKPPSYNCKYRTPDVIKMMEGAGLIICVDFVVCRGDVSFWDEKKGKVTASHMWIELYGTNKRNWRGKQVQNGYRIDPSAPNSDIVTFWKAGYL